MKSSQNGRLCLLLGVFVFLCSLLPVTVFADYGTNRAPDCSGAYADPASLWPPNHKFEEIEIGGVVDPDGDPLSIEVQCIFQDEPVNDSGDGNTQWDASGINESGASVLSERSGTSNGRVYHIDYIATDVHGARCGGEVTVNVNHSRPRPAVDDGRLYPSVPSDNQCGLHAINNYPYIVSLPTLSATSCNRYEYAIIANDPDRDALSYSIVSAPEGVGIDESTGLLQWERPVSGTCDITVRVEDGRGGSDSQSFALEITAPELSITSIPLTEVANNENYLYKVEILTNLDTPPVFSLPAAPSGMVVSSNTGEISWQPQALYGQGIHAPDPFCAVSAGSAGAGAGFADIVAVVDESGSMSGEHNWIGEFVERLEQELLDQNVGADTENLYGLVGFEYNPREILVGGAKMGTAAEFVQAANNLELYGGTEDGWKALQHVVNSYPLRPEGAGNLILITDEDRDNTSNSITYSSLLSSMREKGIVLNAVVNATFRCEDGRNALGVDFTGTGYVADGAGGFYTCSNAYAYSGSGGTVAHYVDLALDTEGTAWDLNYLRSGGQWARSFSSAMIEIKVKEIVKQSGSLPDLTPANIAVSPEGTALSVDIVNRGGISADAPVTVHFYDGFDIDQSRFLGSVSISESIPANASAPATLLLENGVGEIRDILVRIEVDEGIEECHVDNNTALAPVVNVLVSGECDLSRQQYFAVNVLEANVPPQLITEALPQATVGVDYIFKVEAEDANRGDGIGYELSSAPEGMTIDSLAGEIGWRPQEYQAGSHEVVVTVRDINGLEDSRSFIITVAYNHIPVVTSEPLCTATAGKEYSYLIAATDADDDPISFTLLDGPEGFTVDSASGLASWTPTAAQLGDHAVEVKVADDGGASVLHRWSITVVSQNNPPVFVSNPPTEAIVGQTYYYTPRATDPDGDPLTFSIVSGPAGMTMQRGTIQWQPQLSQLGSHNVSIQVDDGQGGIATQFFTVSVSSPPPPLISFTVGDESIAVGESTYLNWQTFNAESIYIDQGIGNVSSVGSITIAPVSTTTYTITAVGPGGTATSSVTVEVIPLAIPEASIGAYPGTVLFGDSSVISWNSSNADTVSIEPDIGTVASQGSATVTPSATTTYIVTATGPGGTATASTTVEVYFELQLRIDSPADGATTTESTVTVSGQVNNNADVTVNGNPVQVNQGLFSANVELASPGQNTITVVATDGYGQQKTVSLQITYVPELFLTVEDPVENEIFHSSPIPVAGRVNNNATVLVNGVEAAVSGDSFAAFAPLASEGPQRISVVASDGYGQQKTAAINIYYFDIPSVVLNADKYRVASGDDVALVWESENCESAVLEPELGNVSCSGSATVSPTETTTFVIRSTGSGKTAKAEVVVVVDDPYGDPSPEEQVHLEAINRARANPSAEAARLNIDLNEGPPSETIGDEPVPPLTFDERLNRAARKHSRDMVDNLFFAHEGSDGSTPRERCLAEGYDGATGENIASSASSNPLDPYDTSLYLHDILFVDQDYPGRGHRVNMLRESWKEVGIGFIPESNNPNFAYGGVVTCDFGAPAVGGGSLVGVVYEDLDHDLSYGPGEGVARVLVEDLESGKAVYTASAGGYSLPLSDGDHAVRFILPDGRALDRQATMAGDNVKLDLRIDEFATARPTVELSSLVQAVGPGESTALTWRSAGGEYAELDQGLGYVPVNGSISVSPIETTTYTIVVTGNGETAVASTTVYVSDFSVAPTVDFSASPDRIGKGESTTLSWTARDSRYVHIDNGIGEVLVSGSIILSPASTTTYTLTATSPAGAANAEVTVRVHGNPAPQPVGSFGCLYNEFIPADATVDEYDAGRFALITGAILDIGDNPLSGARIAVQGHPEYGSAFTGADGKYVLPVEGGKNFTVTIDLDGHLPSQRQIYVPWNDIVVVPSVQLAVADDKTTEVRFDGNPDTVYTHRATPTTDGFGPRAATMVFRGDNRAWMVDENGARIRELSTIAVRATEYPASRSMPAELPKTSAYTYCAELQADGVERVAFDLPVVAYVDNFLGFETGTRVPLGYYDRDDGKWVAAPDGLVVRLLDIDGDSVVDALDADGDGNADDLDGDGSMENEVAGLGDPAVYKPGDTYWRAGVSHFTPWDFNLCSFLSLTNMYLYGSSKLDGQNCPSGKCKGTGSGVSIESQIFHESIPVPGTGFSLVYASDRAEGFKNVFAVPASGTEVPASVKRIIVQVEIAGQVLEKTLPALPNQVAEFVWDGLDAFGNPVRHKTAAHVKVGYVYDSYYMESGYMAMSFAEFGSAITSVPTRDEIIAWQRSELTVNLADKESDLAQGWSISAHHRLHPSDPATLHKGDGSMARNVANAIATAAGNGLDGWPQTGARCLDTPLSRPVAAALNAAGELYVANQVYATIVRIDREGIVEVVAGGGASEEDGVPATSARLRIPADIALDDRGDLYVADAGACKIRRIDATGVITTVAGNGVCESSGDGGPALEAGIAPNSIAVDDAGNLYWAEASACIGGEVDPATGECAGGATVESSYRVRKLSTNGVVSTVVGTGEKYDPRLHADNGDGGPANQALLINPTSVAVDPDGSLYVADNATIRKVNASGIITTVAGTGVTGYSGDGGLAVDAQLTLVTGLAFDRDGGLYFSQMYGNGDAVRKVASNGYISTVAGIGEYGYEGDQGRPRTPGCKDRGVSPSIRAALSIFPTPATRSCARSPRTATTEGRPILPRKTAWAT